MIYACVPVVLVLGALGRRAAGGALNQWFSDGTAEHRVMGDTPARLIFAATVALSACLGGAPAWQALALVPAVWVGTVTGNFASLAMGRGQYSYLHDCVGMSAHAALSAVLPTLVAFGAVFLTPPEHDQWGWMLGLTMLAAPLYTLGWIISGQHGRPSFPLGLRGGSELGEAFWGASCALGAFLTFVSPPFVTALERVYG